MHDLHQSIFPDLAHALDNGLPAPTVEIFDHHMHLRGPVATSEYVKAAKAYGVCRALGIATVEQAAAIKDAFGDFFLFCGWPYLGDIDSNRHWLSVRLAELESFAEAGFVSIKIKIVPGRDGGRPPVWMDDKRIRPLITRAVGLGLSVQAHVGQPAAWFEKYYSDGRAGSRSAYLSQVERFLEEHPDLVYVGVHMGGDPEELDYLESLMERFPNYHIDTSATKWVIRELSRRRDEARDFFIRNSSRILFGSDLVVQDNVSPSYYTSRFHVQRVMWESAGRVASMIIDPDSDAAPEIHGLDLPVSVLAQIYSGNAECLFGGK